MMFPDLYLRLDGESEVLFEQLSNELIAFKVLRGSAILDVARFDRKELPEISIAGPSNSAMVAEDGNYRINARPVTDEIVVRKGKVSVQNVRLAAAGSSAAATPLNATERFSTTSISGVSTVAKASSSTAPPCYTLPSCAGVVSKPPDSGICIRRKVSTRSCRSSRRIFARRTRHLFERAFAAARSHVSLGAGFLWTSSWSKTGGYSS